MILHVCYPHKMGEQLAYIANILQTSQSDPADACLAYDQVFRAQAHLKPSFDWSSDNTKLWNNKFSGRANPKPCAKCHSTLHLTVACPKVIEDLPPKNPLTPHSSSTQEKSQEVCIGFNLSGCTLQACARQHKCYRCGAPSHGLMACAKARSFLSKGRGPAPKHPRPSPLWYT